MAHGNPFIFTYSSGFGALALQLKQTLDDFCSDWVSLDWGKREWPPIGTIGLGGVRGVKFMSDKVSEICYVTFEKNDQVNEDKYCTVLLSKKGSERAPIISTCNC